MTDDVSLSAVLDYRWGQQIGGSTGGLTDLSNLLGRPHSRRLMVWERESKVWESMNAPPLPVLNGLVTDWDEAEDHQIRVQ